MKTIRVSASTEYDVLVGNSLLRSMAQFLRSVAGVQRLCIVSDHRVWALYGDDLKDSLTDAGYACTAITFPAGERSKSADSYMTLLNFLAESHISRSDCIIALGGGVVGDLAGFAAATYLRGIDYIQIPTTLLAMVDSSVGGKTAIDLPAGKNLVGAFYQPKLVLCDTDTLDSLPGNVLHDGCAEVIKYGILYDPDLLEHLRENGLDFDREWVIARCVQHKRNVVAADEFDRGQRHLLNFGHTIGHAIEAESHYTVSHGHAVATGMAMICKAASTLGYCSVDTCQRILDILTGFGLPTATTVDTDRLCAAALSDKKWIGGKLKLIIPREIGRCEVLSVSADDLKTWVEAGR